MSSYLLHNATLIDGTGAAAVDDAAVLVDEATDQLGRSARAAHRHRAERHPL